MRGTWERSVDRAGTPELREVNDAESERLLNGMTGGDRVVSNALTNASAIESLLEVEVVDAC
jgi:hypothetical protein